MSEIARAEQDYRTIFGAIESTLISEGSKRLSADDIRERLDKNKLVESKTFSDDDYYWILVYVAFYSGIRSATVGRFDPPLRGGEGGMVGAELPPFPPETKPGTLNSGWMTGRKNGRMGEDLRPT